MTTMAQVNIEMDRFHDTEEEESDEHEFQPQKIRYSFCDINNPVDQDLLFLSIRQLQVPMSSENCRSAPTSKCPSAQHSRANSVKVRKSRRESPEIDSAGHIRPRTASMPTTEKFKRRPRTSNSSEDPDPDVEQDENGDHYRVRRFTTSSRGIRNRGDSVKRKSKSTNSVHSATSSNSGVSDNETKDSPAVYNPYNPWPASANSEEKEILHYNVLMLGGSGVGRTSLVQQFMTSEYMGADADDYTETEHPEQSISVLLDGEESELNIIDVMQGEDEEFHHTADAFIVVYSITDKRSFRYAANLLSKVTKRFQIQRPIILVGNKSEVVRQREVTDEEGKQLATAYKCKFIETSAILNHQIDELLVGTLRQIRLTDAKGLKKSKSNCVARATKGLVRKIFRKVNRPSAVSSGCDNLYVL